MWARAVCVLICATAALGEAVTKKFCDDVNPAVCAVHSVDVDPCPKGINFCSLYRSKPYTLSVDFTPGFSAQNLRLAMYADDNNDGSFDKSVKTVADPCDLMTCPIDKDVTRFFNLHFTLDKTHGTAKFPVKFKLWNAENESQACCFTFNVKVKK